MLGNKYVAGVTSIVVVAGVAYVLSECKDAVFEEEEAENNEAVDES